jgi:hypothetical protein
MESITPQAILDSLKKDGTFDKWRREVSEELSSMVN